MRRANAPFHSIEVIPMPWLDRIYDWSLRRIFKNNFDKQVLTAFSIRFSLAFRMARLAAVTASDSLRASSMSFCASYPMIAVFPSPFAFFLRKGPIPFVIGPLNGGLPWPPGFQPAR